MLPPLSSLILFLNSFISGQQAFINYGERTNLELLVSYGFMLPGKKDQHTTKLFIPSRQLEETDKLWETKRNLIRTVLATQRYINYVEATAGRGLPPALVRQSTLSNPFRPMVIAVIPPYWSSF